MESDTMHLRHDEREASIITFRSQGDLMEAEIEQAFDGAAPEAGLNHKTTRAAMPEAGRYLVETD
jgi:hypothetical protein